MAAKSEFITDAVAPFGLVWHLDQMGMEVTARPMGATIGRTGDTPLPEWGLLGPNHWIDDLKCKASQG